MPRLGPVAISRAFHPVTAETSSIRLLIVTRGSVTAPQLPQPSSAATYLTLASPRSSSHYWPPGPSPAALSAQPAPDQRTDSGRAPRHHDRPRPSARHRRQRYRPAGLLHPLPALTLVLRQTPRSRPTSIASSPRSRTRPRPTTTTGSLPSSTPIASAPPPTISPRSPPGSNSTTCTSPPSAARATSISFTAAAGDVEQAFQVSFHRYSVNGRNHFANTAEPSLPAALQAAVRSIHGLHDFLMQPQAVAPPRRSTPTTTPPPATTT